MADKPIFSILQAVWNIWELRAVMTLSLSLQVFLTVFVPRRKTTKNMWLIRVIGVAYSLADWIATYGLGVISRTRSACGKSATELEAFWAPFLLLHLSGADAITSLSHEGDHLWLKHLVTLISNSFAIVFILVKSSPEKLLVPSILVFVVAVFRNFQRVLQLLRATHENLNKDPEGTSLVFDDETAKLLGTYSEMLKRNTPPKIIRRRLPPKAKRLSALELNDDHKLNSLSKLESAALLYDTFKCFITKFFPGFTWENCYVEFSELRVLATKSKWSQSVCHINLLDWCLSYKSSVVGTLADKVTSSIGVKDVWDNLKLERIVSVPRVTTYVKEIMFEELKKRSVIAKNKETVAKMCSQRGDWALMRSFQYKELKWSLGELEYGESLIIWHVATELCYNDHHKKDEGDDKKREFCNILSRYMLYLLVLKPKLMVSVAEGGDYKTIFRDTCAHVRVFSITEPVRKHSEACNQILSTYCTLPKRQPFDEQIKSVLVDACVLAKQLQSLKGNQWKLMSEVWVELLTYAAFHCEPAIHAEQPSQGGELLTFVWLLMNHLGLGKQVMEDLPKEE